MPQPKKISKERRKNLSSDDNNFISKIVEYSREKPELAKAILERTLYNLNTDNLTGILSKKGLEGLLDEVKISSMPSGILYVDMMGLKEINDKYGHNAGDRAIKRVADTLKSLIRSKKTEDYKSERRILELEKFCSKDSLYSTIGSNVGRIYEGGDEFVGVLRDIHGFTGLKAATKRISDYFNENNCPSVAIGASLHPPYENIKKTITDAEESMYAAKKSLHKRRDAFNMHTYNTGYAINYPGIGINVILPEIEINIQKPSQQEVPKKIFKEKRAN
jgi:GGDEF domain-containing protein